jgi:hypothetical protein
MVPACSSIGGGSAKFRSRFPGLSMGKCDQRFPRSRRGHQTTRKGWARASPHPVCSVYGAARVQSALPDTGAMSAAGSTRHEPGSRAGTTRLRPSHHPTT